MSGVFTPLFATFPSAMISWDITIAGTTFLVFLIHQSQKKSLKIYLLKSLVMVVNIIFKSKFF